MKKESILIITLLIIAMFVVSACSSGEAFRSVEKDVLGMKLNAVKDTGKGGREITVDNCNNEEACTETDEGNDIMDYGVVKFNGRKYADVCSDSVEIKEFYCINDEEMGVEKQDCPVTYICEAGACIEEPPLLEAFVIDIGFDDSVDLDDAGNSGVNIDDYEDANALELSSAAGNVANGFSVNNIPTGKVYILSDGANALLSYMDDDGDIIGVEEIPFDGVNTHSFTVPFVISDSGVAYQVTMTTGMTTVGIGSLYVTFVGLFPSFENETISFPEVYIDTQCFGICETAEVTDVVVQEYIGVTSNVGSNDNSYFTGMGTEVVTPEEYLDNDEVRLIIPEIFTGPITPGDIVIPILLNNDYYTEDFSVENYYYHSQNYEVTERFIAQGNRLRNAGTFDNEEFTLEELITGSNPDFFLKYDFNPPLEITDGIPFEMYFLGQIIEIYGADSYSNEVTVSVAEEITLQPGEIYNVYIANEEYTITLLSVGLYSVAVSVNNETEIISLDGNYAFGDLVIEVRNILYLENNPEDSIARLAYAPFYIRRTNDDGDAIEEFGYGDDNADAEWVWDISTGGTVYDTVIYSIGAKYNQDRGDWDDDFLPLLEGDQIFLPITDNMLNPVNYPLLTYTAFNGDNSITIDITR